MSIYHLRSPPCAMRLTRSNEANKVQPQDTRHTCYQKFPSLTLLPRSHCSYLLLHPPSLALRLQEACLAHDCIAEPGLVQPSEPAPFALSHRPLRAPCAAAHSHGAQAHSQGLLTAERGGLGSALHVLREAGSVTATPYKRNGVTGAPVSRTGRKGVSRALVDENLGSIVMPAPSTSCRWGGRKPDRAAPPTPLTVLLSSCCEAVLTAWLVCERLLCR